MVQKTGLNVLCKILKKNKCELSTTTLYAIKMSCMSISQLLSAAPFMTVYPTACFYVVIRAILNCNDPPDLPFQHYSPNSELLKDYMYPLHEVSGSMWCDSAHVSDSYFITSLYSPAVWHKLSFHNSDVVVIQYFFPQLVRCSITTSSHCIVYEFV